MVYEETSSMKVDDHRLNGKSSFNKQHSVLHREAKSRTSNIVLSCAWQCVLHQYNLVSRLQKTRPISFIVLQDDELWMCISFPYSISHELCPQVACVQPRSADSLKWTSDLISWAYWWDKEQAAWWSWFITHGKKTLTSSTLVLILTHPIASNSQECHQSACSFNLQQTNLCATCSAQASWTHVQSEHNILTWKCGYHFWLLSVTIDCCWWPLLCREDNQQHQHSSHSTVTQVFWLPWL